MSPRNRLRRDRWHRARCQQFPSFLARRWPEESLANMVSLWQFNFCHFTALLELQPLGFDISKELPMAVIQLPEILQHTWINRWSKTSSWVTNWIGKYWLTLGFRKLRIYTEHLRESTNCKIAYLIFSSCQYRLLLIYSSGSSYEHHWQVKHLFHTV